MPFNADLNPKGGKSMDLLDMIKLKSYLGNKGEQKKPAPVIDKSERWSPPNDMVKSSADDVGTQFKFNNNQSE